MSHCLRSTLFDEVYVHLLPAGNVGLLVPPFIATEIPAFWGDKTFADCSCQHFTGSAIHCH